MAAVFAKKAAIYSADKGVEFILVNAWTVAELATLAVQAILWSHVLSRSSLNKIYPFTSLVFGVNLAAAALIFHEAVRINHIVGIAIIIIGIIVINTSDKAISITG